MSSFFVVVVEEIISNFSNLRTTNLSLHLIYIYSCHLVNEYDSDYVDLFNHWMVNWNCYIYKINGINNETVLFISNLYSCQIQQQNNKKEFLVAIHSSLHTKEVIW